MYHKRIRTGARAEKKASFRWADDSIVCYVFLVLRLFLKVGTWCCATAALGCLGGSYPAIDCRLSHMTCVLHSGCPRSCCKVRGVQLPITIQCGRNPHASTCSCCCSVLCQLQRNPWAGKLHPIYICIRQRVVTLHSCGSLTSCC